LGNKIKNRKCPNWSSILQSESVEVQYRLNRTKDHIGSVSCTLYLYKRKNEKREDFGHETHLWLVAQNESFDLTEVRCWQSPLGQDSKRTRTISFGSKRGDFWD